MKILVIGSGGREHALAWKLKQSSKVEQVFVAPGNAGTALDAQNIAIAENDVPSLIRFAKENKIHFTVVGPEAPLAEGIVDDFEKAGLRIFGPNKQGAQLEGSKVFCKNLLKKAGVPTAQYSVFNNNYEAIQFLQADADRPWVVKADGLAAGKGVIVCDNREQTVAAVERIVKNREFGEAGSRIVIEERLSGPEASVLAITDGQTIVSLQPAQDHKAAYDNDQGPNTGGMGAYCPASLVSDDKLRWIEGNVLVPTIHTLKQMGIKFKGILYAGLMMTPKGPKVLEYNVRFGDPECQPLLFRLKTDLVDVIDAVIDERLEDIGYLEWDERPAVCVVIASEGYPEHYEKGHLISGLDAAADLPDVKVFHAGTKLANGSVFTNGGRVLDVVALGKTVREAKEKAYEAVQRIHWNGCWSRSDIADKEIRLSEKD